MMMHAVKKIKMDRESMAAAVSDRAAKDILRNERPTKT